jgi:hypothetical protein
MALEGGSNVIGAQTPHRLAAIAHQPQTHPSRVHLAPGPFRQLLGEDAWLTLPVPVQNTPYPPSTTTV